jgi:hypothetical protein
MKLRYLFIGLLFMASSMHAQDITDALRFGREDLLGTARFTGMGGAFSSLGGDMSALKLNPAGSSVFLTNHVSGTLNLGVRNNDVNFTNGFTEDNDSTFDLNQAGVVMVYAATNEDATISKYSYGLAYEQVANFDDRFLAVGDSNESIDQFFLNSANGIPLDFLVPFAGESIPDLYNFLGETQGVDAQNALLGYQSFIFDAVDPEDFNNTDYVSNVNADTFRNDYFIREDGYNGKFIFNGSIELKKRFYFGLNLNAHYFEYDRFTSYRETNTNPNSDINFIRFENRLRTRANAFSFQLGTIAKITNQFRAAVSYQSPTWYIVTDETSQAVSTNSNEFGSSVVDPNVINIFPNYNFRTPHKWVAGLSYVFGKSGLISLDYSIQDFSNSEFTTNNPNFNLVNQDIEQNLAQVTSLNLGGEYVFKNFKFRGGYFLQDSPYENEDIQSSLEGFSLGLGYTIYNTSIDLSYMRASQTRNDFLFDTGLSNTAAIDANITNVFLTVAINF